MESLFHIFYYSMNTGHWGPCLPSVPRPKCFRMRVVGLKMIKQTGSPPYFIDKETKTQRYSLVPPACSSLLLFWLEPFHHPAYPLLVTSWVQQSERDWAWDRKSRAGQAFLRWYWMSRKMVTIGEFWGTLACIGLELGTREREWLRFCQRTFLWSGVEWPGLPG